jgi:predicted nucleic acid-binding Zn ribbon protein
VPETECPRCHGALTRPLTAPALQFKGAGWYVNDYSAKASTPTPNGSSETAETKPAGSESTSKPAGSESASKPSTESSAKVDTPAPTT